MRTLKTIKKEERKMHASFAKTGAFWGFIIGFFVYGMLFKYIPFKIYELVSTGGSTLIWSRYDAFLMSVYIIIGIIAAVLGAVIGFIIQKIRKMW